jgi:hypothetical protein
MTLAWLTPIDTTADTTQKRCTQKCWEISSKENALPKPILQRTATPGNGCRRTVALEEVACSSPVGHPPGWRSGCTAHGARRRSRPPKKVLELLPATKPDYKRSGILLNTPGRCDRPAPDHGVVADNRQFLGKVGNRASMDRHDL